MEQNHDTTPKDLASFKSHDQVTTVPKPKDLHQHVTPQYAADWIEIGTQLGLPIGELRAIEAGYPTNVKWCCNRMLEKWLEMDPTASWGKLFTAIESPAVSSGKAFVKVTIPKLDLDKLTAINDKGANAVFILSEMVSQLNVRERFNTDEETWPPDQPKNFTPLVLIRHHRLSHNSMKQATAMAHLSQTGNTAITSAASNQSVPTKHSKLDSNESLQEFLDSSTVTKELTEILAPLEQSKEPQFILIEGAPGIGKSMLLKEIAYMWGSKKIMKRFKLVLLVCLRDPTVQQATLFKDLLQLFCIREDTRASQISIVSSSYLVRNGGKDLAILFDGFDEFPDTLQKKSLIADILKRKVLPYCDIIVSSRPHATVNFRDQATVRVDILGFTEIERNQFIQQALNEQPQSIKELKQYLQDHFTISSLCIVPFNMVVLLFLYKQGIPLPNNSTELYNHFICLTICRHLAKYGNHLDNTITELSNLPDPCNKVIQQLSKFSLKALNNNKLVFTFEEIKEACPDIEVIPGAINGFGLLQAVQHFGLTGKTMTFNFLHFSIQEFLAADYVANLSSSDELRILKEKFWNDTYSNMFAIYMTLTKAQSPSFKRFIKPSLGQRLKGFLTGHGAKVGNRFVDHQVKCFRLFRWFFEAGDEEICRSIDDAKIFNNRIIKINDLNIYNVLLDQILDIRLSPSDVECMKVFLTCSSQKQWAELNLYKCYIQDHGVHILYRGLSSCDITITSLDLSSNGLTESSSFAISDITIRCRVNGLFIGDNKIVGEDERLYSIISNSSSMLEMLHMNATMLTSNAAIKLFTALSEGKKLRILRINNNDINDESCSAIVMAMRNNTSLVELEMHGNQISSKCAQQIVQALQHNNALQKLRLPFKYSEDVKRRIISSAEEINKKRKSCGCQVKLTVYLRK